MQSLNSTPLDPIMVLCSGENSSKPHPTEAEEMSWPAFQDARGGHRGYTTRKVDSIFGSALLEALSQFAGGIVNHDDRLQVQTAADRDAQDALAVTAQAGKDPQERVLLVDHSHKLVPAARVSSTPDGV
ncbi:hypothetical protein N7532_003456 [Penicillium argentinense]|uniref:Uncharacterized protein n=1 Tax=Penicillium argentinense TaxID=1131581 RepID=A0A9W9FMJ7_9EURO|nr:uncharacterized protein N7532_003456 [Penicillium argentinense]KAJ5102927.1 hypothetical protein N7532_003456 [Penicillium argentinense]